MGAAEKIEHEIERISTDALFAWEKNPRGEVDRQDPKYIELRESMQARGQLTPLLVRPSPGGEVGNYDVLAGNRRLAVGKDLGWDELECIVRFDLHNDDDAYEVALIENLQRDDLSPLQEADALHSMLQRRGRAGSISDVASSVGRSESYVRDRLRLRDLVPEIRELGEVGKIDLGGLITLASTSAASQGRMVKRLKVIANQQERVTRSDVATVLRGETKSLRGAGWSLEDAQLVPEAGACTTCKKRTGGQTSLLDEVLEREDECLDGSCYASKAKASFDKVAEAARESGAKVLSASESKKVLEYGHAKYNSAYVDATRREYIPGTSAAKPVAELVPKDAVKVIAQDPESGAPVELFLKKDVEKAVRAAKTEAAKKKAAKSKTPSAPKKVDPKREAAEKREAERKRLEQLVPVVALEQLRARFASGKARASVGLLDAIDYELDNGDVDAPVVVARALGIVVENEDQGVEAIAREARRIAQLGTKDEAGACWELGCLLVELRVAAFALPPFGNDKKMQKALGIDIERARKIASERVAAGRDTEKPAAVESAKKGKARK